MRTESLRRARADATAAFDGRFFERDPLFSPIVPVAQIFAEYTDWPDTAAIDAALAVRAGVRFVPAKRRPRRHRGPVALDDMYDAHIIRGEVPTRARDWHDFLNALVWATYPRAKAALHARQHRALLTWARENGELLEGDRVARLPNARTRELDALALVDEGGVLVLEEARMVFGHALFEGLVFRVPAMIARAVPLEGSLADADALLAARLAGPLAPEILPRVTLREAPFS